MSSPGGHFLLHGGPYSLAVSSPEETFGVTVAVIVDADGERPAAPDTTRDG